MSRRHRSTIHTNLRSSAHQSAFASPKAVGNCVPATTGRFSRWIRARVGAPAGARTGHLAVPHRRLRQDGNAVWQFQYGGAAPVTTAPRCRGRRSGSLRCGAARPGPAAGLAATSLRAAARPALLRGSAPGSTAELSARSRAARRRAARVRAGAAPDPRGARRATRPGGARGRERLGDRAEVLGATCPDRRQRGPGGATVPAHADGPRVARREAVLSPREPAVDGLAPAQVAQRGRRLRAAVAAMTGERRRHGTELPLRGAARGRR
jgi:hypothetical protein